jgi:hypothetical protein
MGFMPEIVVLTWEIGMGSEFLLIAAGRGG